jgi:hypothetical protein
VTEIVQRVRPGYFRGPGQNASVIHFRMEVTDRRSQ